MYVSMVFRTLAEKTLSMHTMLLQCMACVLTTVV
jgi:hypothetical protein